MLKALRYHVSSILETNGINLLKSLKTRDRNKHPSNEWRRLLRDYMDNHPELHAKLLISDRVAAIIGSSNLTSKGLVWNLEIGFLINDGTVWTLAKIVDRISETSMLI